MSETPSDDVQHVNRRVTLACVRSRLVVIQIKCGTESHNLG